MTRLIIRTLAVIMLLFVPGMSMIVDAQQISVDDAMSNARKFLQTSGQKRVQASSSQPNASKLVLAYTGKSTNNQKNCFYVFNCGDDAGFIIMGGDEVAQSVLAYSDNGNFTYDKIPDNFKWWLSQYTKQISYAIEYAQSHPEEAAKAKAKAMAARKASSARSDIQPMVTTRWDQGDPYNSAIPSLGSGYSGDYALATGCVATAMAQMMKYHNYPATGVGSNSYNGINNLNFSANFGNTTYDWGNMTNTYSRASSSVEKQAVATLMYHCGVAVNMKYGQLVNGGSSASTENVVDALRNNFRYNKSIRMEYRKYYGDSEWEQLVYDELAKNRPMMYGGISSDGGHQFICDGYRAADNVYHMNWGWGGSYDCYVTMTGSNAINSGGSGSGGSGAFNKEQDVCLNIIPVEGGLESPNVKNSSGMIELYDGSNKITSYNHAHGSSKNLTLKENIWNYSSGLSSFTLGVKATNITTGEKVYWNVKNIELRKTYLDDYALTFDVNKITTNGTYQIKAVCRNTASLSDEDWYDVGILSTISLPTVTVTGGSDQPDTPNPPATTKTNVSFSISGTSVEKGGTLQISHSPSYTGSIDYQSSNPNIATVSSNGVVTGVSAGTATITAHALGNDNYNETTATFNVTVKEATPLPTVDGICFSQAPYFTKGNPCADDMVIHLPMYNGGSTTYSGTFIMVVQLKAGTLTYQLTLNQFAPGTTYDFAVDLSEYKNYFQAGEGNPYTISFYTDASKTKPFNIPSITYTYYTTIPSAVEGDVDGDGKADKSDVNALADMILGTKSSGSSADIDNDGRVNIVDIVKLIEKLKK